MADENLEDIFIYKVISPPISTGRKAPITFRVISTDNIKTYLLLATSATHQDIYECSIDEAFSSIVCNFPKDPMVVSAQVSPSREKILFVFYARSNGFVRDPHYYGCVSLRSEAPLVMFPICNSSTTFPRIQWLGNEDNIVFSTDGQRYEVYNVDCQLTNFQIRLALKSKSNVVWWNVREDKHLEYITYTHKTEAFCFHEANDKNLVPLPHMFPMPIAFKHLADALFSVFLYIQNNSLGVIIPHVALHAQFHYSKYSSLTTDNELFPFASLSMDFLCVITPLKTVICVLLDCYSQPRASFTISFMRQHQMESLRGVHASSKQDGSLNKLEFDYKSIVGLHPEYFLPLLHYSVMCNGSRTIIFHYLTDKVLHKYWMGTIFEEYFLTLFRHDPTLSDVPSLFQDYVSTFCPPNHFLKHLHRFEPYQVPSTRNEINVPRLSNWKDLIQNKGASLTRVVDVLDDLIRCFSVEMIEEDLHVFTHLQLFVLQLHINKGLVRHPSFVSTVYSRLGETIAIQWVKCGLSVFDDFRHVWKSESSCSLDSAAPTEDMPTQPPEYLLHDTDSSRRNSSTIIEDPNDASCWWEVRQSIKMIGSGYSTHETLESFFQHQICDFVDVYSDDSNRSGLSSYFDLIRAQGKLPC